MLKRSGLNSPYLKEVKKKKRHILRTRMFLYVLLCVLVIVGIIFLFRWNKLLIQSVQVVGAKSVDATAVEKIADDDIAGRYLWVIPKSNFLFYPKGKIKSDLATAFPVFKDISINVNGSQALTVTVDERQGKYMWCGDDPAAAQGQQSLCYFMDDGGYIFGPAPYFSGSVYFKFYGNADGKNNPAPLGVNYFPNIFSKLISFETSAGEMGVKVTSALVKDNGDIEFYLASSIALPNGPKILLDTDANFDEELQNLQAALGTDPLMTAYKTKYSALQYIDLRYGDKVYYKFAPGSGVAPTAPKPLVPQNG